MIVFCASFDIPPTGASAIATLAFDDARSAAVPSRAARLPGFAIGEFQIHRGRVTLRKTGNSAAIDRWLLIELLVWWRFQLCIRLIGAWTRLTRPAAPTIWFAPQVPHSRYLVQAAAILGGMRTTVEPAGADVAFLFEDATHTRALDAHGLPAINGACTDISKSRVATAFEAAFGYPLALDPRRWTGPAVEKSEANGTHDGRIVQCPLEPHPGFTYQRMIETVRDDGFAYDLRTHCIDHRPVIVWEKRRAPERRFLPPNISVRTLDPLAVFSPDEIAAIGRFTRAMGADWCGLDILRDGDGRIYVVDVNKTDAGPIIALSLREQIRGVAVLSRALSAMIASRRDGARGRI